MGPSLGSVAVLLSVIPGRSRGGSLTDGLPDEVSVCRPRRRLRRLYFFHSFLRRKGRPRTRGLNRTVGAGVGQRTQTLTRLMREHQQQFFLEQRGGRGNLALTGKFAHVSILRLHSCASLFHLCRHTLLDCILFPTFKMI